MGVVILLITDTMTGRPVVGGVWEECGDMGWLIWNPG